MRCPQSQGKKNSVQGGSYTEDPPKWPRESHPLRHQLHVFMSALKLLLPWDSETSKEPVLWAHCPLRVSGTLKSNYLDAARVAGAKGRLSLDKFTHSSLTRGLTHVHTHAHSFPVHTLICNYRPIHTLLSHTYEVPHSHTPAMVSPFANCLLWTMYCARLWNKAETY